jgi:cytochrome b561
VDSGTAPRQETNLRPTMRYTATAQWLHWITALLVLATIPIAWQMVEMKPGLPVRTVYFTAHKSIGVTIPSGWPHWTVLAAKTNHFLLYVLLLGMPASGYLRSATDGRGISYLGLFNLPHLPQDETVSRLALAIHHAGQWALYALVVLHMLGTAWHVVVRRDGALDRMLPPQTGVP